MRRILIATAALLLLGCQSAYPQSAPRKFLSAATDNATLVLSRRTLLTSVQGVNTTATVYYLKLYDKATLPVCGTDVPVMVIPIAPNSATPPVQPAQGLQFYSGLGFCVVAGLADNDNTAAAIGLAVNLGVSGQ